MVELSLEQMIKLRDDTKRYKERKEAELNDIPTGVRSGYHSADEAFLSMSIERLNQVIAEYDEIIGRKTNEH